MSGDYFLVELATLLILPVEIPTSSAETSLYLTNELIKNKKVMSVMTALYKEYPSLMRQFCVLGGDY